MVCPSMRNVPLWEYLIYAPFDDRCCCRLCLSWKSLSTHAGKDGREASVHEHTGRARDHLQDRERWFSMDRIPSLLAIKGHPHRPFVPNQGAIHGPSQVGLRGRVDEACGEVITPSLSRRITFSVSRVSGSGRLGSRIKGFPAEFFATRTWVERGLKIGAEG